MARSFISVDRVALEKLIGAAVRADLVAVGAAIDEITIVHGGSDAVAVMIQLARKKVRGIVDRQRDLGEEFPIPGLRVGSTLAEPKIAKPKAA